ncbi:MAG: CAP domain-containing protein [Proteobacteria bacterium]|nr:CAP domain-containing protein [Pseudomonadota bacterium]
MTDLIRRCQWCCASLLLIVSSLARADVVDSINEVRAAGCAGGTRAAPLTRNAQLDEVARRLGGGASLHTAQAQSGYRAASAYSVTIADVPESGDVRHIAETQFCSQVTKPNFHEIGVWRNGSDVWVIVAEPMPPLPAAEDHDAIAARVLELVNLARSGPRRCGAALLPAAPPLARSANLERAAQEFAQEMATFAFLSHTGHDGSAPNERITRSGYRWTDTAENLASGATSPEVLVSSWLGSPEHCSNIMDPTYTQMGLGYAVSPRGDSNTFWALEFGHPAGR